MREVLGLQTLSLKASQVLTLLLCPQTVGTDPTKPDLPVVNLEVVQEDSERLVRAVEEGYCWVMTPSQLKS